MRKISELSATDFPGIDPVKFAEWKKLRISSNRNLIIGVSAIALIMLLAQLKVLNFGAIEWLLCVVALFFVNFLATLKFRKLTKELNLSNQVIREARKKP